MVKNDNLEKKIDNQIKVLIVDDEKSVLSSIISLCNKSNFDYKAYESGEDVIENFTDYDPDVILLDVNLSGISGIDIAKNLTDMDKYSQIILMTGGILDDNEIDSALNYGVRGFVQKPLNFIKLKLRIKSFANARKEYKRIEGEFIRSKEQIEIISKNSPDYYFSINNSLKIIYVNNPIPQFNKRKLIGKKFISLIDKAQKNQIQEKLKLALESRDKIKFNLVYKNNNKLLSCYETIALRFNQNGNEYGLHLYARDITKVLKLQQENLQKEKMLERKITADSLYNIISQKMFSISGYHTLLLGNISKEDGNYEYLKKMGDHIAILNDEIKKFSLVKNFKKVEHHKGNYILKPIDEK